MAARDHHTALKSEIVTRLRAGFVEIVLAKLQWGKEEKAYTLHANPTSFSTAGLQMTDWLSYLGFQRSDRCQFTEFGRCFSREVSERFDVQAFAAACNVGYGHLQRAEQGLQACGFRLLQPEGWGFFMAGLVGALVKVP